MAEETTTRIYDIKITADEALKNLAELRQRSVELAEEQKRVGAETGKNSREYLALGQQIKAINSEARTYEKQIQSTIKYQNAQEQSLLKLRTQLSLQTAEFVKLGNTEEEIARKDVLRQSIADTTAELKRQEETLGDHRRSTGDYEKATISLRTEIRELTQELATMAANGMRGSDAYNELAARAGQLRDAMDDANQSIRQSASDTQVFDTMAEAAQGVAAAYGVWKSAATALGIENEAAEETIRKLMVATTALNSLKTIQNMLQKQSNVYVAASNIIQKLMIKQTIAQASATNLASVATRAWNAILRANPVFLMATALAAVVAGIALFTRSTDKSKEAQKLLNAELEKTDVALKRISADADFNIALAEASGASTEQLRELRLEAIRTTIQIAETANDAVSANRKATKEQRDQAQAMLAEAYAAEKAYFDSIIIEDAKMRTELKKAEQEAAQESARMRAENLAKQLENEQNTNLRRIELAQDVAEAQLRASDEAFSKDYATRVDYEAKLFELQQNGAITRLNLLKEQGKITEEEQGAQLAILDAQRQEFNLRQAQGWEQYLADTKAKLLTDIQPLIEDQIAEYGRLHAENLALLESLNLSEFESAKIRFALEQKLQEDIAAIQESRVNLHKQELQGMIDAENALAEEQLMKMEETMMRLNEYAQAISEIFNQLTALSAASADRQIEDVKREAEQEKMELANRHANGLLTEAQYNKEILKLEQKQAKEEAKIKRNQAIKERAAKIFSIVTDTAQAVMKAIAESPLTFGLPWSAFATVTGALQAATVLSQPLPQAARGMYISGRSHSQGGQLIEAEGGEAIVNARSMSMYGQLVSLINQAGGGVPFTQPFMDGGFSVRNAMAQQPGITSTDLSVGIANAFKEIKIVATIEDIQRETGKYIDIQSAGIL